MGRPVRIGEWHARQPATQGAERLGWADLDDQQLGLLAPQARVGLGTRHQGWIARWSSGQEPDNQGRPPLVVPGMDAPSLRSGEREGWEQPDAADPARDCHARTVWHAPPTASRVKSSARQGRFSYHHGSLRCGWARRDEAHSGSCCLWAGPWRPRSCRRAAGANDAGRQPRWQRLPMTYSTTARLMPQPAPSPRAVLSSLMPKTAFPTPRVNTCVPAPSASAYARAIHARWRATSPRRIASNPNIMLAAMPDPNASRNA